MKTIFDFKPGDRLRIPRRMGITTDPKDERQDRRENVRVIRQYPHHLLVENKKGVRWSITNAELYQLYYGEEGRSEEKCR